MNTIKLRWLALFLLAFVAFTGYVHGAAAGLVAFVSSGLVIEALKPVNCSSILLSWTGVSLAELFLPTVYADIQPNNSPETTAFSQSGVAVSNEMLQGFAQVGVQLPVVPFWNDLDSSVAPNLSDDTDTNATPGKVDTTSLKACNAYLNKGYGAADLAVEIGKSTPGQGSPMTRIRNRFGKYWMRQFQYRVIAVCRGVLASNVANNSGDMLYNIALETTVGVNSTNKISADAVINAVFSMGDQFENMRAIAMHSVVYQNLITQQLITFMRDATGTLQYPTYLGLRVIVDDGLPVIAGTTSGFKYLSIIFGSGAIGYGTGQPTVPFEAYRLPTGGNGGGTESIWERVTWLIHPFGLNWTDNSRAGKSPTLAELRLATNWTRILPRKVIPMAFLQTNG